MKKFTEEQKKLLEQNPAIKAVLARQVIYSQEFKEKALKEYEAGKSANQIFLDADIDITIISKQKDYASKILSEWRLSNAENVDIYYKKSKKKKEESAYKKLLKKYEYLEAENEFLKKLQALNNQFKK